MNINAEELKELLLEYGSVVFKKEELTHELHCELSEYMLDCLSSDGYTKEYDGGYIELYAITTPNILVEYNKLMDELKAYVKLNKKFPMDESVKDLLTLKLSTKFNSIFDVLDEVSPKKFYKKQYKNYVKLLRKL